MSKSDGAIVEDNEENNNNVENKENIKTKEKEEREKRMIYSSIMFADSAVKRLVALTVGEDVSALFDNCVEAKDSGYIMIEESKDNKSVCKYKMYLDLVDKNYSFSLSNLSPLIKTEKIKEMFGFLVNSVNIIYVAVENYMKARAEKSGQAFDYKINLDQNMNIYLDAEKNKRIGVVLRKVD